MSNNQAKNEITKVSRILLFFLIGIIGIATYAYIIQYEPLRIFCETAGYVLFVIAFLYHMGDVEIASIIYDKDKRKKVESIND